MTSTTTTATLEERVTTMEKKFENVTKILRGLIKGVGSEKKKSTGKRPSAYVLWCKENRPQFVKQYLAENPPASPDEKPKMADISKFGALKWHAFKGEHLVGNKWIPKETDESGKAKYPKEYLDYVTKYEASFASQSGDQVVEKAQPKKAKAAVVKAATNKAATNKAATKKPATVKNPTVEIDEALEDLDGEDIGLDLGNVWEQ